jgi:transcriptional regulator
LYQPPHFREERIDVQHELIRSYPLGLLISAGPGGLMANPIPFLVDEAGPEFGTLRCHLARANEQARELQQVDECLVVFQGPQVYVTPSWYATKGESGKVVPTWNYVTVHASGRPKVIEDAAWLRRQLDDLTLQREGKRPAPWKVDDAPAAFVQMQIKGIIGVEIPILRLEGKWKVSQNRPHADRVGVRDGLLRDGQADEAMARLVAERGDLDPTVLRSGK